MMLSNRTSRRDGLASLLSFSAATVATTAVVAEAAPSPKPVLPQRLEGREYRFLDNVRQYAVDVSAVLKDPTAQAYSHRTGSRIDEILPIAKAIALG